MMNLSHYPFPAEIVEVRIGANHYFICYKMWYSYTHVDHGGSEPKYDIITVNIVIICILLIWDTVVR